MHITSLPTPYGIGTMGKQARGFIDFLKKAGQSYWQILPVCPTSYGDSPYQSFSTYAGNPYIIDLDELEKDGLLKKEEYENIVWGEDETQVDYGVIYQNRFSVLRKAGERLWTLNPKELQEFCAENASWVNDYALFMALKERYDGVSWTQWPEPIRRREPEALAVLKAKLEPEIKFWEAVQFLFYKQWATLKTYANDHGVSIIGDVPIYVSTDSVDVWANSTQFYLDDELNCIEVAGCPPDAFTDDGQLWGNPLFRWDVMAKDGYKWWVERVRFQCAIYDTVRIDHFRGFEAYYAIPAEAENARNGKWCKGPGIDLFNAIENSIGRQDIIAEDLGFLTEGVYQLLKDTHFPGMKVLQFAFDSQDGGGYLPHDYPENCVAYIGTHDNTTISAWLEEVSEQAVARAKEYLGLTSEEGYNWGMMRGVWASKAAVTVVQMQDILGLGAQARMNKPSTVGTNWLWRAEKDSYNDSLAEKLLHKMQLYSRLP